MKHPQRIKKIQYKYHAFENLIMVDLKGFYEITSLFWYFSILLSLLEPLIITTSLKTHGDSYPCEFTVSVMTYLNVNIFGNHTGETFILKIFEAML
jgi:hypothetical protein